MQEAFHRLDAKVSHIYHNCNALVEKADGLTINQAVHMKMAVSHPTQVVHSVASVAPAAVVTPEPAKKKPRLLTLYFSPVSQSSAQTTASTASAPVSFMYTFCM